MGKKKTSRFKNKFLKLIWNTDFLTFLGILLGLFTFIYTNYNETNRRQNAFRKRVIFSINELYQNTNHLRYSRNQIKNFDDTTKINDLELKFLNSALKSTDNNITNIRSLLKDDLYLEEIKDEELFVLLSLINSLELNFKTFLSYREREFSSKKLSHLDFIIHYQFFTACSLRKAYKINHNKDYLINFRYFDDIMKKAFLMKYDEINLEQKSGDFPPIKIFKNNY